MYANESASLAAAVERVGKACVVSDRSSITGAVVAKGGQTVTDDSEGISGVPRQGCAPLWAATESSVVERVNSTWELAPVSVRVLV